MITEKTIGRFIKVTLIFICAVGIPIAVVGIYGTRHSEKVEQARTYLAADSIFSAVAGDIEGIGWMVSDKQSLTKLTSYMEITVDGSKKDVGVVLFFRKDTNDKWTIDRYEFK
jgi:hypothetical protein